MAIRPLRVVAGSALLVLSALLAGCAGDDGASTHQAGQAAVDDESNPQEMGCCPCTDPAPEWCRAENATASPVLPVTLGFQDCLQLHTFFPFPIAALQQLGFQLPPGFQFASSDGQTVDAFLAWWSCPAGRLNDTQNAPFADVGSMFASIPVVPPADLAARDPDTEPAQLDLYPLTWVVSNQLAARFLDEIPGLAGGYVDTGDVLVTQSTDGPVSTRSMTAHASFGTFDVDAAYQAAPAEEPAGRYRMWLWPEGGEVAGYLGIAHTAGTTLGSGHADLRFQGDPDAGAPPATGGMAHVVDGTGVALVAVALL
jgi:hypothetical protein